MKNKNQSNPLLSISSLKNRAVPFNLLEDEHFLPAIEAGIEKAKSNLEVLISNQEPPSFANTIEALETLSDELDYAASVFFTLNSSSTNETRQKLALEIGPKLAAFSSDVSLNPKLFKRVESVFNNRKSLNLSVEQMTLLEKVYEEFRRNGALLSEDDQKRLREIDKEKAELNPRFAENLLKHTNSFEMHLTNPEDISGLPESAVEAAKALAKEKGYDDGWLINLDYPSYMPFVTYADNRELRKKISLAYRSRALGGEFDNQPLAIKISRLRHERAQLLGYKTHADFVLERRMAGSPETVHKFLDRIAEVSKPAALNDITELQEYVDSIGGPNPVMPWDLAYYSEKLKEKKFHFNEEELRPYFKLENVVNGAFEHARRLYGITFRQTDDYPKYHEDVDCFEVYDEETDDFIGLFYTDFFPRPSKRGGAWMTNFHKQGLFFGEVMRPHVVNVCNFTKPTPSKPSLLTYQEVRTLFHEFGHALHGLLTKCQYRSLSGTSVYWDFVELPSQVMENWTLEHESLSFFAKHYESGEAIPKALTEKLKNSALFQAGYNSLRQVMLGKLDLAWHDVDPTSIKSVTDYEDQATKEYSVLPHVPGTNVSCTFAHIFAGGYSAGYYSYKWAEVLDADAFELFKEQGLYNAEAAKAFKENILEKGGSEHPMTLYKKFRGREPDPDALLRRDQLI